MAVPYAKMGLKKSAAPHEMVQRMNDINGGRMKMKHIKRKSSSMKCKSCGKTSCAGCKMKNKSRKETRMKKLPKLGSGKRFSELKGKLGSKGAKNPGALAAWIGRKKYGAKKFGNLSAKGKKA